MIWKIFFRIMLLFYVAGCYGASILVDNHIKTLFCKIMILFRVEGGKIIAGSGIEKENEL